jgi:hypothetical protein
VGYSSTIDIYDAGKDEWSDMQMPRERGFSGVAAVENKIYIAGGKNLSGSITVVDVYNHVSGEWSVLEAPHPHPIASVISVNGKVFIAGGDGKDNRSLDIYDTTTETWTSTELSDSRFSMGIATANQKVVFFGGNFSRNIDVYDVKNDTWQWAKLSDGVTGVIATSMEDRCLFTGLLYHEGYTWAESMIIIRP